MKTTKKLVIMLLVLVLGVAAFIPSTFSWYDHNDSLTGNRMGYTRNNLPVSAGNVTVETKKYYMDSEKNQGGSVNKIFYDEKGNKEYNGNAITSGSVAGETTQYYGTTFTNSGSSPAYVNLYLNGFTNDPNNYIGTIAPSLTHKNISSSVHLTNKNMIRVYFQIKGANNWKDGTTYLVYKTKTNSTYQYKTITNDIMLANDTGGILDNIATKYVDLDDDTTEFYFATNGNNNGFNTSDCSVTQPWYRTQTITNIQAETGYYLTGVADDTTFNAQYGTFNIPGGISVKTYFDTMTINSNQHAYVTLTNGVNFTGASAAYTGSGITVNGNSGYVTAGSISHGTNIASITTTITGSLGDSTTVTTNISNPSTQAAPVALNVEVPARHENEDGVMVDGTAEVVWYIQNGSSAACEFNSVYFTE